MKVTDIISDKINRLPAGYIFTYDDFTTQVNKVDALTKAISRMVQDGIIRKLSPGKFYKPQLTEFGELKPDVFQVVKDLLVQNGKVIGYLTGYSVYNQLGLTTQVSSIIQIGSNEPKKAITRGMYKIKFIKQPNKITKENTPLLCILDTIRTIKDIPDTSINQSIKTLSTIIKNIKDSEKATFIRLATKYNPATRALVGSIFEYCFSVQDAEPLYNSLKKISKYEFGISENVLPNKLKWNII